MTPPRPVVALDVDGVLNPDRTRDGFIPHRVRVAKSEVPKSPFVHGHGEVSINVPVRLNPAHAEWITGLREVADVVWATTWENAANSHLAPLLGIDPLPVGVSVATHPPRFEHVRNNDVAAWKADVLAELFAGRALAWIDDQAGAYETPVSAPALEEIERAPNPAAHARAWRRQRQWPTLVLVPDPGVGLTFEHCAAVDAFVAEHSK